MGWVIIGIMVLIVLVPVLLSHGRPGHEVHRHYSAIHMRKSADPQASAKPEPDSTKTAT